MQCSRCEFENMPGLTTCMRCGTVLTVPEGPADVNPPRMPRWKKPFRLFFRGLRKTGLIDPLQKLKIPGWLMLMSKIAFFGIILSIVPGLAHIVQRRFRKIRWWVLAWFLLLGLTVFLFGGFPGLVCLGLTLAVHIWIALHSSFLQGDNTMITRLVVFLLALVLYYFVYMSVGRLIFQDIQTGYAVVGVPQQQVEVGDFLLGRPSLLQADPLPRGSFVYADLGAIERRSLFNRRRYFGYTLVIGLPGETVDITGNVFFINQIPLDPDRFPVPQWLRERTLSVEVPPNTYFLSAEYVGYGYNAAQAASVCLVPRNRITARAFLRWWPIWRRGYIEMDE